jgi:hypothetical protein
MRAGYNNDDTEGALQTSLKVTLSGAMSQVLDGESNRSMRPDPSLSDTMRT